MKKIKNKKGAAHVEMMVSFVIFIGFLIFFIIIFKPLKIFSVNTSSLDLTEAKIIDYVSSPLTISSITLNSSFVPDKTCFHVPFNLSNKVIFRDENSNTVEANKDEDYIYFNYISGNRFYRVYSSEELVEKNIADVSGCEDIDEVNYTIGVTRTDKKISENELESFFNEYSSEYSQLKKNLNLANNFNIIIRDGSEVVYKGERTKPAGIDIIAKDISIEILDSNAELKPAIMNIQTWD